LIGLGLFKFVYFEISGTKSVGGPCTATVAFTVDRSGRVLSARLAGSSGDSILDQEAVALARRVSPVPPPPANVGNGGSILLSVPVRFGASPN
jgi:protein TonB